MRDRKQLAQDHDEMRNDRRREESAWRDITSILAPDEQDFDGDNDTDSDNYEVFDSSPIMALNEFSGGMFGENVNPADRWMELSIANTDLAKWGPVQAWLYRRASTHFRSLSPAVSDFYSEATSWFSTLGRLGNACLYQEEWLGKQRIIDKAMSAGEMYIRLDAGGRVEAVDREFKLTGRQTKSFIGSQYCGDKCQDDHKYIIVHSVYPNEDYVPGAFGNRGKAYCSTYWSKDLNDLWRTGYYYELPFHWIFWNKRAGRTWATGAGHIARADMNMLNEMERSNMVDAQFAAEPPILTAAEGIFTSADIHPNAILEGAINAQGKKLVDVLQRGDNPQRAESKTQQVRDRVKEAFFFSMMQVLNRPQMTATEYMGWKEEKLRLLGPQLVRVQQGLSGFVARRDRILQRAGQFDDDPMPPELQGHVISVQFVSPMVRAQKMAAGKGTLQWINQLATIAEQTQDPSVMDVVNMDGSSRVLHDAFVGLPEVINDQKTVAAKRQARAEAQARQVQVEQAATMAGTIADVAHASQAMTSSKQRSGKRA